MFCRELKYYLYNNGNILTLSRYGASNVTPEDNFTYTYNGNKLVNLSGTYNGTPLSNANYRYDANGNMTHDGRKGIDITYDINNMPKTVSRNDTLKAAYTYLSDGTKMMVQDRADNTSSNGYLYLGSMVFKKTGTSYAFESTDFGGGRIINVNGTFTAYYYTTDHLGSVRAITDASGNVTERNDYYPFGESMTTGNTYPTMSVNRWKYNGKETQTTGEVNWLDYGARMYDEVIGRWTRVDPMSEKYYGTSGYAYCVNNPIRYVDPLGTIIEDPDKLVKQQKNQLNQNLLYVQNVLKSGDSSDGMIVALNNLARALKSSLSEISTLEKSDQVYSVHYSEGQEGGMQYNSETGAIDIGIGKSDASIGLIGHELEHAYQYEKGQISLLVDNSEYGKLYDITDETAAYNRERTLGAGVQFFQTPNAVVNGYPLQMGDNDVRRFGNTLTPPAYQTLPDGPIDINSREGKVLRKQTIEAGRVGMPIKEVYKGWQRDYLNGSKN